MADHRTTNRAMFWRILRRLLGANRGRLFVIMLALGAGAAVTAALLNLQVDAKRRLTTEFRAFGANFVVAPRGSSDMATGSTLRDDVHFISRIREQAYPGIPVVPFLYIVAGLGKASSVYVPQRESTQAVIVGTSLANLPLVAGRKFPQLTPWEPDELNYECLAGEKIARILGLAKGDYLELFLGGRMERVHVLQIISVGDASDDQVFVDLGLAQRLARLNGQVSLVQVSYAGTPKEIEAFQSKLTAQLPNAEVRPIRQFTEGEAKIYNRISGLLTATVGIVLLLTALCVMAAMTNVAMERKMDVGLMKAIGGSMRRVLRLFLAEAALLGLAGGMIGAAAGIFLSIGLGKVVFDVAARPRLIVYPVAVALTIIVAIISAYPLRRLASIRPASVFRGEA